MTDQQPEPTEPTDDQQSDAVSLPEGQSLGDLFAALFPSPEPPTFVADEQGNIRAKGDGAIISNLDYGQDERSRDISTALFVMAGGGDEERMSARLFEIVVNAVRLAIEAYVEEGYNNDGEDMTPIDAANAFVGGLNDHIDMWAARAQYLLQQEQQEPQPAA